MTRLLVFGGSFDPPHRGHAALLSAAARKIRPDRIMIVPAYHAPLKDSPGAPAADRLIMTRLFLKGLPASLRRLAAIDPREMLSRRRVYTVETLERLKKKNPAAELHFAVGSDSAAAFGSWRRPRRLKALCRWWTARRPGAAGIIPGFFKLLPGTMPDISSTQIRAALALGRGGGTKQLLAHAVSNHIERRKLYGKGLVESLGKSLSPERFHHTLAVARLAESLARRWGLDPSKARLAGLLHDCGRSVPVTRMASYARRRRLKVPDLPGILRHRPLLLHAYISADLARRRYDVKDPGVLSAIRGHTLGGPRMSALDRLVYAADAASEDRAHPEAARLRRLAFEDLEEAFRACVLAKVRHALSSSSWLHPMTVSLWNSLQR